MTDALKPTCDRKTKFWKNQQNTFGLLPGLEGTCPCATTAAGGCWHIAAGRKLPDCYVAHTMSCYGGVRNVLEHNTKLLMNAPYWSKVALLDDEFNRFKKAELKHQAKNYQASSQIFYRLHWSGDIFDVEYARALSSAIQLNSDIHFWCYTRSFFAVSHLCNLSNLTLYLSLDPVNIEQGLMTFAEYKNDRNNLQFCYMSPTNTFRDHLGRVEEMLKAENKLRKICKMTLKKTDFDKDPQGCPVDCGKLELEYGCSKCQKCIRKLPKPVWFQS
jgi:hypothetical protein